MEHVPHTIIFLLVDYSEAATPSMLLNKSCRRNLLPTVGSTSAEQKKLTVLCGSQSNFEIDRKDLSRDAREREGRPVVRLAISLSPRTRALRTYVRGASLARLSSEEGYGMIESVSRGIRFIRQSYVAYRRLPQRHAR